MDLLNALAPIVGFSSTLGLLMLTWVLRVRFKSRFAWGCFVASFLAMASSRLGEALESAKLIDPLPHPLLYSSISVTMLVGLAVHLRALIRQEGQP